jgi:hypothetical protein
MQERPCVIGVTNNLLLKRRRCYWSRTSHWIGHAHASLYSWYRNLDGTASRCAGRNLDLDQLATWGLYLDEASRWGVRRDLQRSEQGSVR